MNVREVLSLSIRRDSLLLILLLVSTASVFSQAASSTESRQGNQLFVGYSFFSNSFNGHASATSHTPLNGWEASFTHPLSGALRLKFDESGYYGTSLSSPQHPLFFLGGVEYVRPLGKASFFLEGLGGYGHLNSDWWGGEGPATTSSFTAVGGGGIDTRMSARLAFRVQADLQYANFTIPTNDQIHSLPNYFARISAGPVFRF